MTKDILVIKILEIRNTTLNLNEIYQYNVLEELLKNFLGKYATICKGEEALRTQKLYIWLAKIYKIER